MIDPGHGNQRQCLGRRGVLNEIAGVRIAGNDDAVERGSNRGISELGFGHLLVAKADIVHRLVQIDVGLGRIGIDFSLGIIGLGLVHCFDGTLG